MASSDYISREALLSATEGYDWQAGLKTVLKRIPAADARPVVLCRDCKWCHAGYCEKYDDLIPFGCANKPWEDWFCADGKKREER